MQLQVLNLLQQLLLPLALGAVVVAGLVVLVVTRVPRQPRQPLDAPPPADDLAASSSPAPAALSVPDVPEASATAAAAPAPVAPPAAAPRPLRTDLLLVDDSAVVRAKLRRLLAPAGYTITQAPDGEAARALLAEGRYRLLLTDLEMPRLDGVGLVRATQADPGCAGMPILVITGHDNLQSQLGLLGGVNGIHRKPWVDDELLQAVQALVAPSRQTAEAEPA